ncbi:pyridoxal-phosphate dependent enzyme [Falsarthrobacter nasiphocae]|uniref:Cystathionine beta-synthase n=1 Tax=Falsarthrobacter nasiphocae TaxID=189863 RepID=A0AAE4C6D9_9MICC|nr:pyridoxal-phosphate dependent enzyme [Falsarthrobacter nasiphocae]MDR6892478.1 cystathionine beta-synthase [Falsarthrobacter nasiphocae]
MDYADSILDLIGNTPLVRLNSVTDGIEATVLAKLEYLNPGGSVKDRIAAKLVEEAERSGQLAPGGTIVEPTSGNTGVGLALVAQQRGYGMVCVTPDKVGEEKRDVLRAYGASVAVVSTSVAPDSPESYYGVSDALAEAIPGAFKPDQFNNPAAPQAHYESTGPEIWRDTDGLVTHFVAGAGTGGTVTGTGRYLKEVSASRDGGPVRIVVSDPQGSVYSGGAGQPYFVEGVGEDMWPANYDPSVPDEVVAVTDAEAFAMTRRLAREEGLLVGGSSGMAVVGALRIARDLPADAVVVVLLPDSGRGYLGKVFNDSWMAERGFEVREGEQVPFVPGVLEGASPAAVSSQSPTTGLRPLVDAVAEGAVALEPSSTLGSALEALAAAGRRSALVGPSSLPAPLGRVKAALSEDDIHRALLDGRATRETTLAEALADGLVADSLVLVGAGESRAVLAERLAEQGVAVLTRDGLAVASVTGVEASRA